MYIFAEYARARASRDDAAACRARCECATCRARIIVRRNPRVDCIRPNLCAAVRNDHQCRMPARAGRNSSHDRKHVFADGTARADAVDASNTQFAHQQGDTHGPQHPFHPHRHCDRIRRRCAPAPHGRKHAGACARRTGTGARLDVHRQRRHFQPVRFPRHFADQREARDPGRLRCRAQERLLRRHLGVEHQLDLGRAARRQRQHGMGFLRRLQVRAAERLQRRRRRAAVLLSRQLSGRRDQGRHHRALCEPRLEVPVGQVQLRRRQQDVRLPRFARQRLHRGQHRPTTSSTRSTT